MSNLTADIYEDNNCGIILVIHDKQGNAKYIHTYDGYCTDLEKGYSWDGEEFGPFWNEQDACSLGDDLKAFAEDPTACTMWCGNELGMWTNDDMYPDEFDRSLMDDNDLVNDVYDGSQYVHETDMTPAEAGKLGEALKKSGAC